MTTIFRLSGRQLLTQIIFQNERNGMFAIIRPLTLKPQPVQPVIQQGHDERNMKLGRPQSPHLTIYAPQLTSLLSISHRATGMILAGYTVLLGTGAVMLPDSISHYLDALQNANVGSGVLFFGKFSLAFPFCYHFWNGIRHLCWDLGHFFTIKEVYATGYAMLGLTVASSLGLSSM